MAFDKEKTYCENYDELLSLTDVFPTIEDFVDAVNDGFNDFIGVQPVFRTFTFDQDFVYFVANCLFKEYETDKIVYLTEASGLKRFVNTFIARMPPIQQRWRFFYDNLLLTVEEGKYMRKYSSQMNKTNNQLLNLSTSETEGVDVASESKGATTPVAINPATTAFADKYTNAMSKDTDATDRELETTTTRDLDFEEDKTYAKDGNFKDMFSIFRYIPPAMYDEVVKEFAYHFAVLYC